jgi:hypothetical protein
MGTYELGPNAVACATTQECEFMACGANEWSRLSRDFVAAGEGLGAFGAALILPVQTNYEYSKAVDLTSFLRHQGQGSRAPIGWWLP